MTVEVYSCSGCGQVKLRMIPDPSDTVERRGLVCGGEQLDRANGGQTHEWTRMTALGVFTLGTAAA